MATKVFPALKRLTEEDGDTKNVSTARDFGLGQEESVDQLQTRLGRFLGRLASRAALPPERAADIWKRVSDSVRK